MDLPKKEKKALVQARVSERDLNALKRAKVDIPELIRQAITAAAKAVEDERQAKGTLYHQFNQSSK